MPLAPRWLSRLKHRAGGLGARGERHAKRHLKRQKHRVLASNLRTRFGEVDLLTTAPDGRTVVIVEVKAGRAGPIPPERHFTADKRRRLTALAGQLLRRYQLADRPVRFDLVAVEFDRNQARPTVRHYPAACEASV